MNRFCDTAENSQAIEHTVFVGVYYRHTKLYCVCFFIVFRPGLWYQTDCMDLGEILGLREDISCWWQHVNYSTGEPHMSIYFISVARLPPVGRYTWPPAPIGTVLGTKALYEYPYRQASPGIYKISRFARKSLVWRTRNHYFFSNRDPYIPNLLPL